MIHDYQGHPPGVPSQDASPKRPPASFRGTPKAHNAMTFTSAPNPPVVEIPEFHDCQQWSMVA